MVTWIRSYAESNRIRKYGFRKRYEHFSVWELRPGGDETADAGVAVVTSRGFRTAVDRNLARRRICGCIMDVRSFLRLGSEYLFECRPGADKENYQLLVISFKKALNFFKEKEN